MNRNTEELGFDEVIDTAVDAIEVAESLVSALKDGIQISDAGILLGVTGRINEIIRDRKVFVAQVQNLNADESMEANYQISRRLGRDGDATPFVAKAIGAVTLLARWHRIVEEGFELVTDTIGFVKPSKTVDA